MDWIPHLASASRGRSPDGARGRQFAVTQKWYNGVLTICLNIMLVIGTKAPAFAAPDQAGKIHNLSDYAGKWVLLYFYPKDFTSGCTTEACGIRDNYEGFKKIDAIVLGVSTDSVESHAGFAKEHSLPFPILSDPEKKIVSAYEANGIMAKRISYLIDPESNIIKTYDNVDPAKHAAAVLADLAQLKK